MQIFNKWRYILVFLTKFLKNVEFFIPQRSVQDLGGIILVVLQILDADNGQRLESSTGRIATRDIVQFVPMREVHGEFMLISQYKGQKLDTLNKIFATIGAGTDNWNPTLAQSVLYVLVFLHNIQNIDIYDVHIYIW